ncbi:MAG: hypothetical protein IJ636_00235, partial [Bacteroidales bacterium]|nr:hypothetical protein [Bacteroidales bacterium]
MRTLKTIRNNLPALLMAVLLTLSCQFRDVDTNPAELQVRLRIPDMAVTKAETGEVGPVSEEMALHSMHLWVFLHNAQTLIASKYLSESDIAATGLQGGIETFFTLDVPDETYKTRPNVDVYVVFNAAGAGLSLGTDLKTTTPATLDAFVLQGNYFGTESLTGEVPAAGLPMAGV